MMQQSKPTPWRSPSGKLGQPGVRLFLTSASVLFLELLLIRWIPANVVFVGYFSNFLLMGSFLGIGIGILLGRSRDVRFPWLALLLFAVVVIVARAQLNLQLASQTDVFFGLADESNAADVNFLVLPLVIGLSAAVMAAASLPLGKLLTAMPPLRAYAIDISGSMAGIAAFALLSFVGAQPVVWFALLGVIASVQAIGRGLSRWSVVSALCLALLVLFAAIDTDRWSPYQRITILREPDRIGLAADGVPHQGFFLDPSHAPFAFYTQVDRWFPGRTFGRVLIVGAGAGNDTQIALRRSPQHVDAVEIDPTILGIGIDQNPARPYADPRVSHYVDDGRAFIRNATAKYDLIVYAVTDSLTLVSNTANLRLESYLFTKEGFESVRDHLAPDGLFVLYNFYRQPWLVEKLGGMLDSAFGYPPIVRLFPHLTGSGAVLATGPAIAALHGAPPPGDSIDQVNVVAAPAPATDDWPFVYLQAPGIAPFYLVAIAFLLLLGVLGVGGALAVTRTPIRRFSPHFFALGAAFMLLETRSLAGFSLLFGTTWTVNALVFFAILASVLAAIGVNMRWRIRSTRWLYLGLAAGLVAAYVVPPESLLFDPAWLRYAVASALAFVPVFLANLVFAYSFRDTETADTAFASNVLGAVVGGCLEYVALLTGYRALLLIVLGLYGAAYVLATKARVLADRELVSPVEVASAPIA